MSYDSGTAKDYRALKEIRSKQKEDRLQKHDKIIQEWVSVDTVRQYSIQYRPNSILFRFKDKPKADFFPSTGRWRSQNQTYRGGAEAFLEWHNKQ